MIHMIRSLILSLTILTGTALAQFVTVTGTVLDPSGAPYQNGSGRAVLVSGNGSGQQAWTVGGTNPVQTPIVINALNSFGQFSAQVASTAIIDQQSAQPEWQFSFCANQAIQPQVCFTMTPMALASNQDISATIRAQAAFLPANIPGYPVLSCTGFSGADLGAKIANCLAALPVTGGTVDARGFSGAQSIGSSYTQSTPGNVLWPSGTITVADGVSFLVTAAGTNWGGVASEGTGVTLIKLGTGSSFGPHGTSSAGMYDMVLHDMQIVPASGKTPTQLLDLSYVRYSNFNNLYISGNASGIGVLIGPDAWADHFLQTIITGHLTCVSISGLDSGTYKQVNLIDWEQSHITSCTDGVIFDGQTKGVINGITFESELSNNTRSLNFKAGTIQGVKLSDAYNENLSSGQTLVTAASDGTNKLFLKGLTIVGLHSYSNVTVPISLDSTQHTVTSVGSLSASRATNVVTLSGFGGAPPWNTSDYLTISGCGDSTFNHGNFAVTAVTGTTVTYTQSFPIEGDATTTGCTVVNLGDQIDFYMAGADMRSSNNGLGWVTATGSGVDGDVYYSPAYDSTYTDNYNTSVSNNSGSTIRLHYAVGLNQYFGANIVMPSSTATVSMGSAPSTETGAGGLRLSASQTISGRDLGNTTNLQLGYVGACQVGNNTTANAWIMGGGSWCMNGKTLFIDDTHTDSSVQSGGQFGNTYRRWTSGFINTWIAHETTAPSASSGDDVCYGDSTAHALECSYNNDSFSKVIRAAELAAPPAIGNTTPAGGSFTTLKGTTLNTTTNCASGASPAVCGSAAAGAVAVPVGTNPTLVVDTSAVTANSLILLTIDESLTISATTCNTTLATLVQPVVTARSAGVSFTMQIGATVAVNPACVSYVIVN